MIEDVGADGGMNAGGEGNLELGAHAVGACDQNGFAPALAVELKQRAKAADGCENAAAKCFSGHRGNAPLGFIRNRNIDAGIGVAHETWLFFRRAGPDQVEF